MKRGLTLIELMVALIMTGFVVLAATSAYTAAFNFEEHSRVAQEQHENELILEARLRSLLSGIYVSPDEEDATTFLLGEQSGQNEQAVSADVLTFTTLRDGANSSALGSGLDFETAHEAYGPQGGVTEVTLALSPTGELGQDRQGLFVRRQHPADGDPTQGGYEGILDADVASIWFEFYTGEGWDLTWGTSGIAGLGGSAAEVVGQNGRRIPSAIRVTYVRASDPDETPHSFVVRLPNSDVTSQNPSVPGEVAAP